MAMAMTLIKGMDHDRYVLLMIDTYTYIYIYIYILYIYMYIHIYIDTYDIVFFCLEFTIGN